MEYLPPPLTHREATETFWYKKRKKYVPDQEAMVETTFLRLKSWPKTFIFFLVLFFLHLRFVQKFRFFFFQDSILSDLTFPNLIIYEGAEAIFCKLFLPYWKRTFHKKTKHYAISKFLLQNLVTFW